MTSPLQPGSEHEFEAELGLPEPLPAGERLLWQGTPDWRELARRAFHVRKLALYFGVLLAWRCIYLGSQGAGPLEIVRGSVPLAVLGSTAVAIMLALAWLTARTTVYTVTDRRVVMRIGIVLSLTFNLPYAAIGAAGLRRLGRGCGDMPLQLSGSDRIAVMHLWPHARPWRWARPEPMLRCVPDCDTVATLISAAWAQVHGKTLETAVAAPAIADTRPAGRPTPAAKPATDRPRRGSRQALAPN